MKSTTTIIALILSLMSYGQFDCSTPEPFDNGGCTTILPPNNGPISVYYTVNSYNHTEFDFDFTPFVSLPACGNLTFNYTLLDDQCNVVQTNQTGLFSGLDLNKNYIIGYTVDCPDGGLINTICTEELMVLPVELTAWFATPFEGGVTLRWSTATESNNYAFKIDRSQDGWNWSPAWIITTLDGNAQYEQRYYINDMLNEERTYYYRLTQVDNNGRSHTYPVLAVNYHNNYKALTINLLGQLTDSAMFRIRR